MRGKSRPGVRVVAAALIAVGVATVPVAGTATAAPNAPIRATGLSPTDIVDGAKAKSAKLVETDAALLARNDAERVPVVVKLDYDALSSYTGGVGTLKATSPEVTGHALTAQIVDKSPYAKYVDGMESDFLTALAKHVPAADVTETFQNVYGGVAMTVPANQVENVLDLPGAVAVQSDSEAQPSTDASNAFIGSPTMWTALGGQPLAGTGLIFGSLDGGVWPEHPSFAETAGLPPIPTDTVGQPIQCNFGDNPLTPATDPFVCNRKVIGGRVFLDSYHANLGTGGDFYPDSARDAEGHGTHTTTTAAGDVVSNAQLLGINRGPVSGVAPGAQVIAYKVCGPNTCFGADRVAAINRAVLDGVDVLNHSIGGGQSPFADPVALAFLDAYAAGIFVATSGGNSGPTAGTVDNAAPWVTTTAASLQSRRFLSTLTLNATGGATVSFTGMSLTNGVTTPMPVVLASAPPYNNQFCSATPPPGLFTGKIVACLGDGSRALQGYRIFQGGAAGVINYETFPEPDRVRPLNSFGPQIGIDDGAGLLAFMAANTGVTGTFTQGTATAGPGDIVLNFSSRGPRGNFLKPDLAAPGEDIIAGTTPTREGIFPQGQYYATQGGTSMASPHVAGAALLLRAQHPTWTPGQIKSALMTSAKTTMTNQNGSPATPFDRGAGRLDLNGAGRVGLTFEESAANYTSMGNDPLQTVTLNEPSINAPVMPGELTVSRTVKNVTAKKVSYKVSATSSPGTTITPVKKSFSIKPGLTATFSVTIKAVNTTGQKFGEIVLTPSTKTDVTLHLPVAFVPQQGTVTLTSNCSPASIPLKTRTDCTLTATNPTTNASTATFSTAVSSKLKIKSTVGGYPFKTKTFTTGAVPLPATVRGTPTVAPGSLFGFIPLAAIGIPPTPIGDEQLLNFNTSNFTYHGDTYNRIGVDSNGYVVVGGGDGGDNKCCNLTAIPNAARPNNVLAPFWADLDGTGAAGIYVSQLTDGVNDWVVVEWRVKAFGTNIDKRFQVWIGVNGPEDITFAYDPALLPNDTGLFGQYVVGAENADGTTGSGLPFGTLPTTDLRVTSTADVIGTATVQFSVEGSSKGTGVVTSKLTTPLVVGTTVVESPITISP